MPPRPAPRCLHLGRDAGAPLTGRRRERARWYGWGSLWRGRVWPGARLDKLAPAALKAIGHAGCVAGLHLEASRVWRGTWPPSRWRREWRSFAVLAGLPPGALPSTCRLVVICWPLLRQMQALGVGALTGVPGQHWVLPCHHAELLAVPVLPTSLPNLGCYAPSAARQMPPCTRC